MEPFVNNPKPFFGYSDTTHFQNFLWMNRIPAFYGGALFGQFAMNGHMDSFSVKYLKQAMFESGSLELKSSPEFNDENLPRWEDIGGLKKRRKYEPDLGWYWNDEAMTSCILWDKPLNPPSVTSGILWGGCLESIDELLRHNIPIPSLEEFSEIVLMLETSEEIPSHSYVRRVIRALGEREYLAKVQGVLVGRPKAWNFEDMRTSAEKPVYKYLQRKTVIETIRRYNLACPVVQNLDFGHTDPQICMSLGRRAIIDIEKRSIVCEF